MATTALVCVVSGDAYVRYAEELFESAQEFFHPTDHIDFVMLEGREGWPAATMYRWHALADHLPVAHYVYLSDADMRFEAPVGAEVLPPTLVSGIVATEHPGYVGKGREEFPYETRDDSACYVAPDEGNRYYCGGFVGGGRLAMRILATQIGARIDADHAGGIIPVFHDESALNAVLAAWPPTKVLDPSMCHPDKDDYYVNHVWRERYERKLVALDKSADVRGER